MRLSIGEAADRLGVSVRTLRWYDEIGLVKPTLVGENGYRYYDAHAMALLQQVLFYRELDLPLKEIGALLQAPEDQRRRALLAHKHLLELKSQQLSGLIRLVDETLGGETMTKPQVTRADIDAAKKQYAQEAKERWGHTDAWKESQAREVTADIQLQAQEIFQKFAALRDADPADRAVQELVKQWQDHITENHYTCTKEILSGLGLMYVADDRFTQNIDRWGEGTARLMSEAISVYCKK